ncbi:putative alpha/beta hydrolase-1 [Dioscorea sansibarensis]
MNIKITGKGEQTVILAHGYGASQCVWDELCPLLEDNYRVVVFDWVFSAEISQQNDQDFDDLNYSSFSALSDELITLVEENHLHGSVYVGHSMAGMLGCIASVKSPHLFSHLILIGATPSYLNDKNYKGGFDKEMVDKMLSDIEFNFKTWVPNFASMVVGHENPVAVEKYTKTLQRMQPEIALSVARTLFLSDNRHVLENVQVQCTIIHCNNDNVAPEFAAKYMETKMKGRASIVNIDDDVGHFPQLTAPQKLYQVLHEVLLSNTLFQS